MALTPIQREVCRLLAGRRRTSGESYVAGGTALNELLHAPRRSRDVDIFHDTEAALAATWPADRDLLQASGFTVRVLRESAGFVEALASGERGTVLIQWARDSAYRFFPLMEDATLGLTLHRFDLAVNKVLALAGRLEPRDWIDVLQCDEKLQPMGYLAWAACGKDPGFSPASLLTEARRGGRYSQAELDALDFEGPPPDAATLGRQWHAAMAEAESVCALLPVEQAGCAVLTSAGEWCRAPASDLANEASRRALVFHAGSIGGAWPRVR